MSYHGSLFGVSETPGDGLAPITFTVGNGPNHFQDYLTADEARELAAQLVAAAERCEPVVAWSSLRELEPVFTIDAAHIQRQIEFSADKFGPGAREAGVLDHIRKELVEIEQAEWWPEKLSEWVDVIILAFDGAWRCGGEPQVILDAIREKQERNEARTWPDWRTAPIGKAIEHDRSGEVSS